ncbi:hypothetical protein D3C71_1764140 [compost metagenome]
MFMASSTLSLTREPRDSCSQRTRISRAMMGTLTMGEAMAMNSTSVAAARGCPRNR